MDSRICITNFLCFLILFSLLNVVLAQDAKTFIAQGDTAAKDNKFDDALEAYTKAIKLSSSDYTLFYKRSNIHYIRNRFDDALDDLERSLAINPEFQQGVLRRGQILLRFGRFFEARKDFEEALRQKPGNSMADKQLKLVNAILSNDAKGKVAFNNKQWELAKEFYTLVLNDAPDYIPGNINRALCALESGDYHQVISDTLRVLKKQSTHSTAICLRAKALLFMEETDNAMKLLREGVRLDSENELCTREFKTLQQALQHISNGESLLQQSKFEEAILEFQSLLPFYPTIGFFVKKGRWNICQATSKLKNSKKTLEVCQSVLELEDNHFDAHMLMGEASLELEDFEEAVRFFRKATEIQPQNQQAHQSLQRAEKLRKMALRKDYYKILGVTRDASVQVIRKAYRKLALEWHPDKHVGEEVGVAEKKFTEINEAYEVLNNEEKRRKYDNGDDIQPEHHGHPGGFPGGPGGPFTFHFQWG